MRMSRRFSGGESGHDQRGSNAHEGWNAVRVDGPEHDATQAALRNQLARQPGCIVAEMLR